LQDISLAQRAAGLCTRIVVFTRGPQVVIEERAARPFQLSILVLTTDFLNSMSLAKQLVHLGEFLAHIIDAASV
jgi:hypothetical protein